MIRAAVHWRRGALLFLMAGVGTANGAFVDDPISHELGKAHRDTPPARPPATFGVPGNLVDNGLFDAGLDSWHATGDVVHASGEAILGDNAVVSAILHQPVAVPLGPTTISFDYRPGLSDTVTTGFAPDTAFISLFFFDDPALFDLGEGLFDDALGLLDVDKDGVFNSVGTIIPSTEKGPGWWHFSALFNQSHNYVAIAVELAGLNGVPGDSEMAIDNVILIPEPGTLGLLAFALAVFGIRQYRRGAR